MKPCKGSQDDCPKDSRDAGHTDPLPASELTRTSAPDLKDFQEARDWRKRPQAPPASQGPHAWTKQAPGSRTQHRPQGHRAVPPAYCAKVTGPSGSITTVTATASVTVAVHPTLPGAVQSYGHGGYEDGETDCAEHKPKWGRSKHSQVEVFELEDLEQERRQDGSSAVH